MWLLLFLAWLAFNARIAIDVIITGVVVTALILLFLKKIGAYNPKNDVKVFKLIVPSIAYVFELLWNIILANIHVIYLVLIASDDEIKPRLVYFKSPVQSEIGKVAVANSITLTPGTITVNLWWNDFCVHAIDKVSADGLHDLWAAKRVKSMEEKV